jgi:hypothetical protein
MVLSLTAKLCNRKITITNNSGDYEKTSRPLPQKNPEEPRLLGALSRCLKLRLIYRGGWVSGDGGSRLGVPINHELWLPICISNRDPCQNPVITNRSPSHSRQLSPL